MPRPEGFPGLPAGWESEWETFPASCGSLQLFSVTHHRDPWDADGRGPSALICFHGHGEHGGRYLHFPHYVKDAVNSVICPDWRGHGRSEGLRGHADKFGLMVEDGAMIIRRVDEQLRRRFGRSDIHLLAHSMGGLIALQMMLEHPTLPIRSVTISAPLLGLALEVPAVKKTAGRMLSVLWGSLQMASGLDPVKISHDPAVREAYFKDRLVHSKITPALFFGMEKAMAGVCKRGEGIHPPVQFLIPLQDQIVDPQVALDFARALRHPDKKIRTYEGYYHESFNEGGQANVNKERAFEDLVSWISNHQRKPDSATG